MKGTTSGGVKPKIQNDTGIHISREHQKKINTFAIKNSWMEELTEELAAKKNELKNISDAEGEIMVLPDDESVPIMIGESLIHFTPQEALEKIDILIKEHEASIKELEDKISDITTEMSTLKAELYSQFGDAINLES